MMTNYDTENGGLGVFPGSHLRGPQKDVGTLEGIHHCDQVSNFPLFPPKRQDDATVCPVFKSRMWPVDRDPLEKYWDRCDVTLCLKHMFEFVQCDRKTFLNIFFPLSTDWVANEGSDASEGEGWRRPRLFLSSCPWYHSWLDTPWSHLVDKRKQYISTIGCSSSMTLYTYEQEATQTCLTKREGCF